MAICTFLGHADVYDKDLYKKLAAAVYEVVRQQDETEFLFYSSGHFYDLCLAAVLEAKQHCPHKKITLTWVVRAGEQNKAEVPACVVDRVISPPLIAESGNNDFATARKKLERWAIQQSTHLISYCYSALDEGQSHQYRFAQKRGVAILDVTFEDTADFITECIGALPEREQFILRQMSEGQSQRSIGALLGISSSAVQQSAKHAGRTLRGIVKRQTLRSGPMPPVSCSVFALGEVTYESLSAFEKIAVFLKERYRVTKFLIPSEYRRTGYMYVLKKLSVDVEVTAIPQSPPDFCICDLTELSVEDRKKLLLQASGIKIFDMGKQIRRELL